MLDVDRNEIYDGLSSKYYKQFKMLNYCIGGPAFIVDDVYGLTCTRGTGINI